MEEFSKKFEAFFSDQDFRAIFSSEDLFGFDPSHISIVTRREPPETPREKEWINPEPYIQLDT